MPRSEFSVFERIFNQLPPEDFEVWIKVFHLYMEGVICQEELFVLSDDILTPNRVPEEFYYAFKQLVKNRDVGRRMGSVLCKATSELEYGKMTKFSFSYYTWDKFPVSLCQGRDAIGREVLNDKYISLPQGSDMFKFKIKNQYEDILYQLEDTMTHHDFQIANQRRTLEVLNIEKLRIEALGDSGKQEYRLPKHFNSLRLQTISDTYGDMGREIINLLLRKPVKAIPIVQDRVAKRLEELESVKQQLMGQWNDTCEKNFKKSLDYRSLAFKSHEKKQSNQKAFLADIKNLAVKNSKNLNILKGGSIEGEYFCSYGNFESVCVYTQEQLEAD